MATDYTTSTLLDMTKRVAVTATTIFAILLQSDGEILPSFYHVPNPPFHSRYQWEGEREHYFISGIPEEFLEHDVFISMPPKKIYSVNLIIEKIVRGKLEIVLPEA